MDFLICNTAEIVSPFKKLVIAMDNNRNKERLNWN